MLRAWIDEHEALLWALAAGSLALLLLSPLIVSLLVVGIPPDYFAHDARPRAREERYAVVRLAILLGKNLLGAVLIVSGVAMLVLPGQGLLTLLVGFFLLDFPGKYRLEKWLVAQPSVHRPINWLRQRRGRPPLRLH